MEILQAEIIGNFTYSLGFISNKNNISRYHYVDQILQIYSKNRIVFLNGSEGCGKTEICHEFIKNNDKNSFSVIFRNNNRSDLTFSFFLQNLIDQISFYLKEENPIYTTESLNQLLYKLRRKKREKFYFVIDGLSDNQELIKQILDFCNFEVDNFFYLFSGNKNDYIKIYDSLLKISIHELDIPGFSLSEIKEFLNNEKLEENDLLNIYKITNGNPSKLFIIKRALEENTQIEKIFETDNFLSIIEKEIKNIDLTDEIIAKFLAITSIYESKLRINDLAILLKISEEKIINLSSKISFIEIDNQNYITYVSIIYKKSIKKKLKRFENYVDDSIIQLLSNSEILEYKLEIIEIFNRKKNWVEINNHITEDLLINILLKSGDLNKIKYLVELSRDASDKLTEKNELVHTAMKGSFFNFLNHNNEIVQEVETRLIFKRFDEAIIIANKSIIKIEKLRLLSLIGRHQKKTNGLVDETLLEDIKILFKKCDFINCGDIIYDIISDIIVIEPKLALSFVDDNQLNDSNLNDMIIAKLSILSLNNSIDNNSKESFNENIDKIQNKNSRKITRAFAFILGDYTLENFINEIEKIPQPLDKIKFIRLYLENVNKDNINFELLLNKSIDILIGNDFNSTYLLEMLKLLSSKLSNIQDFTKRNSIISRLRIIENNLPKGGITQHKIEYKLNIFKIIFSETPDKASTKLKDIVNEVNKVEDLLIKTELYSYIYYTTFELDHYYINNEKKRIKTELVNLIGLLKDNSANQSTIFKKIISNIASKNFELGVSIISGINNSINRDKLSIHLIENYINNSDVKSLNLQKIIDYLNNVNEQYIKNQIYLMIVESLSEKDKISKYNIKQILILTFNTRKLFKVEENRLQFLEYCLIIFNKNIDEIEEKKYSNLKSLIRETIDELDNDWSKTYILNQFCKNIISHDEKFAKDLFNKMLNKRDDHLFYSELYTRSYILNLEYLIYSFEGLIYLNVDYELQLKKIIDIINAIPSLDVKLNYLSKLSFILYENEKVSESKKIFEKYIFTDLKINLEDNDLIVLIWLHNPEFALKKIEDFSYYYRDLAILKIIDFVLLSKNPFKIYEDKHVNSKELYWSDIDKALSLIDKIKKDIILYVSIEKLVNVIYNHKFKYSKDQMDDIIFRLKESISSKLPDELNIKHNGYLIISKLQIHILNKNIFNWTDLYNETKSIPNLSDKIFVKSQLLRHYPSKPTSISQQDLLDELIIDLKGLKINFEFIERINELTEDLFKINKTKWTKIVRESLTISNNLNDKGSTFKYQQELIDTIFKIDEKLCRELVDSVDCFDNKNNKDYIKKHHNRLSFLNKVNNNEQIGNTQYNKYDVLHAVIKSFSLFNSEKIKAKKFDELKIFINSSLDFSIDKSIIIFLYYLVNMYKKKYSNNEIKQIQDLLLQNFNFSINNFDFIKKIHFHHNGFNTRFNMDFLKNDNNFYVEIGERDAALEYIKDWIIQNQADEIIIIDPFFNIDDLELLKLFLLNKDVKRFEIITNKKIEREEIENKWLQLMSIEFPETDFYFLSKKNGDSPFHDRYILSSNDNLGLRIGTSINSLGIGKVSEISKIEGIEYESIYNNLYHKFIKDRIRSLNGEKIRIESMTI